MEELIAMYVPAISTALATIVAAITLFYKISVMIKQKAHEFGVDTTIKIDTTVDTYKQIVDKQNQEINELIVQNKELQEQYKRLQNDMAEITRMNAELLAKMEQRGV